jgi:hypothetical protein
MSAFELLNLRRRADYFILSVGCGLLHGDFVSCSFDVVVPPIGDCATDAIPISPRGAWDRPSPPIR